VTVAVPEGAAAAYEHVRPALLDPSGPQGSVSGRVMLLRHGMLAWAHAQATTPAAPLAPRSLGAAARGPLPSDIAAGLVELMAGLILTHHKEPGRCRN
jgi:hypothetical protein